jgi:hypothetical protein
VDFDSSTDCRCGSCSSRGSEDNGTARVLSLASTLLHEAAFREQPLNARDAADVLKHGTPRPATR